MFIEAIDRISENQKILYKFDFSFLEFVSLSLNNFQKIHLKSSLGLQKQSRIPIGIGGRESRFGIGIIESRDRDLKKVGIPDPVPIPIPYYPNLKHMELVRMEREMMGYQDF